MKLDEVELTEDSPQEEVSQPKEEENKNEETQPMLDYDNIKSSQVCGPRVCEPILG